MSHHIDDLFESESWQIERIESLLPTSVTSPEEREDIEHEIKGYVDSERAFELIWYLEANQLDPIQAGLNYNQTDIKNKLNREI